MQIVNELTHRALEYVAMLHRQGHTISRKALDEFGARPDQKKPKSSTMLALMDLDSMSADRIFMRGGESFSEYAARMSWITVSRDQVRLTKLGTALLRELNSPKLDSETQAFAEVVVDPDDRFAYARVMNKLSELGPAMIVDPYLRLEQFIEVADLTEVTRILTTENAFQRRGAADNRELYARTLSAAGRQVEVRHTNGLHDRYYVPDNEEAVWMLGVSLNGISKNISVLTKLSSESSGAIRRMLEDLWEPAIRLEPYTDEADKHVTKETAASPTTST